MDQEIPKRNKFMKRELIAIILIPIITIGAAIVLYSMIMTPISKPYFPPPLGIAQDSKYLDPLTLRIVNAPETALVADSEIFIVHNYTKLTIEEIRFYNSTGVEIAIYTPDSWYAFYNGSKSSDLVYDVGMSIEIYCQGISPGDRVIFTSYEDGFCPTEYIHGVKLVLGNCG